MGKGLLRVMQSSPMYTFPLETLALLGRYVVDSSHLEVGREADTIEAREKIAAETTLHFGVQDEPFFSSF